ncbi:MAG: putative UDP-N-acetylmuramoylalanine--D-glutamate ligase [Candidatus Saccharibacteria bacterium]|nr:putative UDP-N-acetylmuramoylalanine--D-glutamate ligase [Candidatus Saccharibacteria bacterium]
MKIAIAGYGAEGKASFLYWNTPEHDITIADERESVDDLPAGIATILGAEAFQKLSSFDLVIRTAGLAPEKIVTDGKVWSATNEFFAKSPAPIIGVTGTKGKGTTASLITSILKAAGKTVHLVGNIGTPALEILPVITANDIVVYELSSFQLWDLEKSPSIAVVLMIEPDHLNVHRNLEEYIEAKANIRRHQGPDDYCIYHPTNAYAHQIATTGIGEQRAARYGTPDDNEVYIKENTFFIRDTAICSVDALQLPGTHNQENACAAISAARHVGVDNEAVERGLRSFEGLPHRLELVRELDGVAYYNDSFSSAPGATIAAIRAFDRPEILIIGGTDKGADFSELAQAIRENQQVKQLVIMGTIGHKLADFLRQQGVTAAIEEVDAKTMLEVIGRAREYAVPGDIIILSPACASFDMFKNFEDRGNQFRDLVRAL